MILQKYSVISPLYLTFLDYYTLEDPGKSVEAKLSGKDHEIMILRKRCLSDRTSVVLSLKREKDTEMKCSIHDCKEQNTKRIKINPILPGWIRKNLIDADYCKYHAKKIEIKTHREIYYKTYDEYKTEFEGGYTFTDWWEIRSSPFTHECIKPNYFNELELRKQD
jgi:hypothetical protein